MNVPAVSKKSFDENKNDSELMKIVHDVLKKFQKTPSFSKRARFAHKLVEEFNSEVFSSKIVKELSPCKVGCSACCHTQVSVTEDEARLLVQRIKEGISIDEERLLKQTSAGNKASEFFMLSFQDRKCIFLDETGACKVYKDRPSVCRTNAVLGDSKQCDTSEKIQPLRLIKTTKSDMVIYGSFLFSKISGTLPEMVWKVLQEDENDSEVEAG